MTGKQIIIHSKAAAQTTIAAMQQPYKYGKNKDYY